MLQATQSFWRQSGAELEIAVLFYTPQILPWGLGNCLVVMPIFTLVFVQESFEDRKCDSFTPP